ncbi:hypothetical protein FOA43_000693 [Brettanomyces nanus]|uniref:Uncharacterized protein n=1 Tax=Eeniella nana TaxID=13502 RepID=A0A875RXU1_EENNA|nr:uncharacterized protein FOA43_000693 [Brettanomyces nanus]QPG73383.1 hypothetical protein FOA43_000693 [Brettanomyces nanus]
MFACRSSVIRSFSRENIKVHGTIIGAFVVVPYFVRLASDLVSPKKTKAETNSNSNSLQAGKSPSIQELYEISEPLRDNNVHIDVRNQRPADSLKKNRQYQIEKVEQNIRHLATPRQMKAYLDSHVIGQDNCKKVMAVAIYNHYLRVNDNLIRRIREGKLHSKSVKSSGNILDMDNIPGAREKEQMALEFSQGSSAVESPELEKSNLMLIGPSGSGKTLMAKTMARVLNVPIVIQDCTALTQAGYIGEDIADCIQKLFVQADYDVDQCERGIIVLDEVDKLAKRSVMSGSKDISGEGVQQSLLKLIEGGQISVQPKQENSVARNSKSSAAEQNVIIDSSNILFIAMGAFIGLDDIIFERLVADVDENITDTYGSSLQRVSPEDLVKFGMIPEFIGRLPVIATLKELTAEDLERVLVRPKNSIIKQYEYTFSRLGIKLAVTGPALQCVAHLSLENGTGARGLHSILSKLLLSANYECPGSNISYVLIDRETIEKFMASLKTGGKSFDEFKPKYYNSQNHDQFLETIRGEDPLLESRLRNDLM